MANPSLLDLDDLLSPLPGDNPCGEPLRYDPIWDRIQAARRGHAATVSEGVDADPDWDKVRQEAADALSKRSKDLQLCGWLTEALVWRQGFAGFRDGLQLLYGLLDRFWDGLYPLPDGEDYEVRAAPLYWLTGPVDAPWLPALLRSVPLAVSDGPEVYSLAFRQSLVTRAQRSDEDPDSYALRERATAQRAERFQAAVASTRKQRKSYYADLHDDLTACEQELAAVERIVVEKFGAWLRSDDLPKWAPVREALETCRTAVEQIGDLRPAAAAAPTPAANGSPGADGSAPAGRSAAAPHGPLQDRATAVERLREVAEFFKQTEPHSPIAPLIDRAVRWANSPFEAVLMELVQDEATLNRIRDTLGLRNGSAGLGATESED